MKVWAFTLLFVSLAAFAEKSPEHKPTDQKPKPSSVLFKEGDFRTRQLVVPGFDELPLDRKLFAYYLSQAAIASDSIFWTQASQHGLALKDLFDNIWEHKEVLTPAQQKSVAEYMFKLYADKANYDYLGNKKILLENIGQIEFLDLVQDVEKVSKKSLTENARYLLPVIFDPNYQKSYMANEGEDQIANTYTHFYEKGFTEADFQRLTPEQKNSFLGYPRSSSKGYQVDIAKINGRFSKQLIAVDYYMSLAQQYANPAEKEILQAYREALHSGKVEDLRRAETLWVQNKSEDIEFQIGFIEVYHDPMKIRGSWEAFVMLLAQDSVTKARVDNIRKNASYFEAQMPVDDKLKKEAGFTPPKAEGAYSLCVAGGCGERPFAGVNLPNDEDISEKYGTKSFGNLNVMKDINQILEEEQKYLQNWLPKEYQQYIASFPYELYDVLQVELHEILGHGSGRNLEGVNDGMMGTEYSALEEMRAETASLYQLMDPKMMEFGILPQMTPGQFEVFNKLSLSMFFAHYLGKYEKLAESATQITQAHRRGALVMTNYLLEKGAIEIEQIPGEYPHVVVPNVAKAREALGSLWAWIQKAKSTGDVTLAEKLFREYAVYNDYHKNLRSLVVEKMKMDKQPREGLSLSAPMRLVTDANGKVTDVQLEYFDGRVRNIIDTVDALVAKSKSSQRLLEQGQNKLECSLLFL